jgi:hypothetical protein
LTVLSDVRVTGSISDFGFAGKPEGAVFLRSLSGRITPPVMSDDEPLEYLATQAIADFIATAASVQIDGIIFSSVQAVGDVLNVVLFTGQNRKTRLAVFIGAAGWRVNRVRSS